MILPTHAMVGLALAVQLLFVAPEHATVALIGVLVGSVFADRDPYAGHRRTLHYPIVYSLVALPGLVVAILSPSPAVVGLVAFLVGAAVHCRMDRYGGGLELRPWEGASDRAVYDHVRGRWRRPKRWIRYDGSPGDLLLLSLLAVPPLTVFGDPFRLVVAVALVIGAVYVGLRRRLASIAPTVFGHVPDRLAQYVSERYRS